MTWVKSATGVVSWPNGFDDEPDDSELEPVDLATWLREERDNRICQLYRADFTPAEIAAELATTSTTVHNVLRAREIPARRTRSRQLASAP
ncbi:hypothetical protein [Aeromicrobium endophyticum]|uniref:Uncharacterized protein n=1 Tax=Aeromicrobium endophyticum TaxID=2292704 RepID=A0A371PCL5_9ACTN|nr:hypothetical protein [Aeromicrobium endophyticum]REK73679.1 hypothetical protein DX116_09145 [Aeromicrobium endophyticum]